MQKNKDKTHAARVRDLEKAAGADDKIEIHVDWNNTPDSELPPGTRVIKWGDDGEIVSYIVRRPGGAKNARRNNKTN